MILPDAQKGEGYVCERFLNNIRQPGGTPACFLVMDYNTKNRARIRGSITADSASATATLSGIESVGHCTRYIPKIEANPPVIVDGGSITTRATSSITQDQKEKIENTPSFYI